MEGKPLQVGPLLYRSAADARAEEHCDLIGWTGKAVGGGGSAPVSEEVALHGARYGLGAVVCTQLPKE